jgi:hypothetical protein
VNTEDFDCSEVFSLGDITARKANKPWWMVYQCVWAAKKSHPAAQRFYEEAAVGLLQSYGSETPDF